jgi:filamentous hemagglutinin
MVPGQPRLRFRNPRELARHHALHQNDFGAVTEAEYEAKAEAFMRGPKPSQVEECTRTSSNEILRFNPATQEFGILTVERVIVTYFKPRPCATLPHWEPKVNCHGERDNLTYFRKECTQ